MLLKAARGPSSPPLAHEKLVKKLELVERQADRMIRLTDNLLDISRITAGRLELHTEKCDLAVLVREAVERLQEEAERTGSEVQVEADAGVEGIWDPNRLEQVITNLLSNAIKYGKGHDAGADARAPGDPLSAARRRAQIV